HASIRQVNRPDFSINQVNPQVRVNWEFQDRSDIATGMATYKHTLITANTAGELYALHLNTGEKLWSVATGGKIYGTPALWESFIVVGSSDGIIYCVDAENGQLLWQLQTPNAVLGSAAVQDGVAYIGG